MISIYYSEIKDGICLLYLHECGNLYTLDRGFGDVCGIKEDVREFLLTFKYNLIGVYHEN
jgi:hypothetical protein